MIAFIVDAHAYLILDLNILLGHPDDQGAYCCGELAGLFAIILLVNLIYSLADITSRGIEVGYDSLSALNKGFDTWPLESSNLHFDLLSALWKMISSSPVTWRTPHVGSHQDDDPNAELDWWAKQNVQMDNLVNCAGCSTRIQLLCSTPFPMRVFKSGLATANSLPTIVHLLRPHS